MLLANPEHVVSSLNTHIVYSTVVLPGFPSNLYAKNILVQLDQGEQSQSKDAFGIQHVTKSATDGEGGREGDKGRKMSDKRLRGRETEEKDGGRGDGWAEDRRL